MMANDPIRVGLIGYGLGGEVFHAPLIAATDGMELTSIVTSNPERQARAKERYPDAGVVDSADALWSTSPDHDVIVVCTPNSSHLSLGSRALELGLPVVVDKPFMPTSEEGQKLVDLAREKGLFLSVFQNRRWDADFLTVKRLLDSEVMGEVVRFESRYERWKPEAALDAWRESGAPEEGGGLLFDLGSHLIDQALVLFGPPTHVYAEVDRRRPGVQVDDDTFVGLVHRGGQRSHLWMSVMARLLGPRFRILGSRGAFEKHGMDPQEPALAAGERPDGSAMWGSEPEELWGTLAVNDTEKKVESEPGAYQAYYAGVRDSLRLGAPPPVDPRDSVLGLRIIEAAQRSARSGTVERLDV